MIREDIGYNRKTIKFYAGGVMEIAAITVYKNRNNLDILNCYNPVKNTEMNEFAYYRVDMPLIVILKAALQLYVHNFFCSHSFKILNGYNEINC